MSIENNTEISSHRRIGIRPPHKILPSSLLIEPSNRAELSRLLNIANIAAIRIPLTASVVFAFESASLIRLCILSYILSAKPNLSSFSMEIASHPPYNYSNCRPKTIISFMVLPFLLFVLESESKDLTEWTTVEVLDTLTPKKFGINLNIS